MATDRYENPLMQRYASAQMQGIFSADNKFTTWRRLWVALAEAERDLGLNITDEQLEQMRTNVTNIDYDQAKTYEKKFKHDVMAHVHAFGDVAPKAKGIIHLGATSAYVGDNADVIIFRQALKLVYQKTLKLIDKMSRFALEYADLPTLGFTHFQPAQLTTVGKRAALWLQDLLLDIEDMEHTLSTMRLRGVKGTTGTQASFMSLFDNDEEKVKRLEQLICEKMAFDCAYAVTGQTYSRKADFRLLNCLSAIAQSLHKCATDIRLLQHLKEIEEPFGKTQIGSSAMAYKRNPMKCERVCSLARYVIVDALNPALTASIQWFERTLDDSANRRISIPEAFLATDAILELMLNVFTDIVVNENVIAAHIMEELPFMLTENILMECVKKGGDRQEAHEKMRVLSMEAAEQVKVHGRKNDLVKRIAEDGTFGLTEEEILQLMKPEKYTGRAGGQVREFIDGQIKPLLEKLTDQTETEETKY